MIERVTIPDMRRRTRMIQTTLLREVKEYWGIMTLVGGWRDIDRRTDVDEMKIYDDSYELAGKEIEPPNLCSHRKLRVREKLVHVQDILVCHPRMSWR